MRQVSGKTPTLVTQLTAFLVLILALVSADAAVIRSAEPFIGVTHHQIIQTPGNTDEPVLPRQIAAQILEIEMDAPGLDFFLTPEVPLDAQPPPPAEGWVRRSTTRAFVDSVGAQLGINGDFYQFPGTYARPVFTGVSDGNIYSRGGNFINVTADNQAGIWTSFDELSQAGQQAWTALGGNQRILTGGQVTAPPNSSYTTTLNPHTAIGVSENQDRVFFFVVDGRQAGYSNGMRTDEMAELMRYFGAWDAINVDGGGSTTMVIDDTADGVQNARVLNIPSDGGGGTERRVANNLAVFATPNPDYVPLPAIDARVPVGEPRPVHAALTMLDSFEQTTGTFADGPDFTGSINLSPDTTLTVDPAVSYLGDASLRVDMIGGDQPDFGTELRLSSDDRADALTNPDEPALGTAGHFGFYMRIDPSTTDEPLWIALNMGDGTAEDTLRLRTDYRTVEADGQWHLVEWQIDGVSTWSPFYGDTLARGPNTFFDALLVRNAHSFVNFPDTPWNGTFWIDALAYDPHRSLAGQIIPEPALAALALAISVGIARRRAR